MSIFQDILSDTSEEKIILGQETALRYRQKQLRSGEAEVRLEREAGTLTQLNLRLEVQTPEDLATLQPCFQEPESIMRAHLYDVNTRIFVHFQLKAPVLKALGHYLQDHPDADMPALWQQGSQVPGLLHLGASYLLTKISVDKV